MFPMLIHPSCPFMHPSYPLMHPSCPDLSCGYVMSSSIMYHLVSVKVVLKG
jgi:hypothetical protein